MSVLKNGYFLKEQLIYLQISCSIVTSECRDHHLENKHRQSHVGWND